MLLPAYRLYHTVPVSQAAPLLPAAAVFTFNLLLLGHCCLRGCGGYSSPSSEHVCDLSTFCSTYSEILLLARNFSTPNFLWQSSSKMWQIKHLSHSPIRTHIYTLMAEAAMQSADVLIRSNVVVYTSTCDRGEPSILVRPTSKLLIAGQPAQPPEPQLAPRNRETRLLTLKRRVLFYSSVFIIRLNTLNQMQLKHPEKTCNWLYIKYKCFSFKSFLICS